MGGKIEDTAYLSTELEMERESCEEKHSALALHSIALQHWHCMALHTRHLEQDEYIFLECRGEVLSLIHI